METTKKSQSEQQADAQLSSIREMVAALECDYDRLEELQEERDELESAAQDPESAEETAAADKAMVDWDDLNGEELADLVKAGTLDGEIIDADKARQRIEEDALSVEVRSDWHTPGAEVEDGDGEYCILLCTGGPAVRIIGNLSGNEPTSASLEHQDWGTAWTERYLTHDEEADVLTYARCFFCG